MLHLVWIVPVLPLAGFVTLLALGRRLSKGGVASIGVGSVGLSALVMAGIAVAYVTAPAVEAVDQALWTWWSVGGFAPVISFRLDALSLVMALVVTGVGFLIHLYSMEFMAEDEGYARFFAYMNLFMASMLVLLLADNLVVLLLGWEAVGLCSYLLIGFWYSDPANGRAARKAFVVTRVGDVALTVGLFLLFHDLGTLDIAELMSRAAVRWTVGSGSAVAASALLLGGAVGKSAQLPLQTWLPDAMAGPTPVSALIHAATMVTAGVYLIARTHVLFLLAPGVMEAVAVIGTLTLLLAGAAALGQSDIKRVLAYSTISQIGYMFLALGVGAWSAAIFHFMTHAFFKALLFLGAGVVIHALHDEHDIHRMGGLRKALPTTFWTFLAGSAALTGFPLVTAGFYSKDLILDEAFGAPGGHWLWAGAIVGALLTGLYIFRVVFLVFLGEGAREPERVPGWAMRAPLVVLGVLALVGGFVETPSSFGGVHLLSRLLGRSLPPLGPGMGTHAGLLLQSAAAAVALIAIAAAWILFRGPPAPVARVFAHPLGAALKSSARAGFGFDWLYDRAVVRSYLWLARVNRRDVADRLTDLLGSACVGLNRALVPTEDGRLRRYAAGIALGAVLLVALAMLS